MKKANGIVFAQAQDNNKVVVANKYVAHTLYEQNKAIVEKLGGEIVKGVGGFRAEFPTAAKAKKFVAEGITEISKKEYNAARKSEPKANKKPAGNGKGNKKNEGNKFVRVVTLTDAEGNKYQVPASALQEKEATRKGKGNAVAPTKANTQEKKSSKKEIKGKGNAPVLTDAGKKALDKMKMSVLNRAASAYSIANGGAATTFSALGKAEKELKAFMPNAKAGLLKSPKWAQACKTYGLTEDMLG